MKRQGSTLHQIEFTDAAPTRSPVTWLLLFIAIVLLVAVLIAIGFGAIDTLGVGDTGPRLICTIGDEVVFSADVDAAEQTGVGSEATITITRAGHTGPVTPPTGGECFIAR